MKRFLSTLLVLMLLAVLYIPAAAAEDETPPKEAGSYYVYTENGKGLNVRDEPSFRGKVVGSLKCGSKIHVDAFTDENWALILYKYDKPGYGTGEYAAWVNRRYLTKKKPAAKSSKNSVSAETAGTDADASDALSEMNSEFRGAKEVEKPYAVTLRPTRVTGWVNVRWAPSLSAEILATYKANDQLLVIRELPNWLQVEDPDTGSVGFVRRNFIVE